MIESRSVGWEGHLACTREKRLQSIWETLKKSPLEITRHKLDDNIKI
jgi:hypothetical protein